MLLTDKQTKRDEKITFIVGRSNDVCKCCLHYIIASVAPKDICEIDG